MARTVSIGAQGFADLRERGYFFVDKSPFVRDWWKSGDAVTLICRPRRFGKTLNLSMVECFFSSRYANRGDLFEGLDVWNDGTMRAEQGQWPVVLVSFAGVKAASFDEMRADVARAIAQVRRDLWPDDSSLGALPSTMHDPVSAIDERMDDATSKAALNTICEALFRQTGRRAIVLLDEYDTPLQEAWLSGYWDQASEYMRGLFNLTFKTNAYLERGLMTGVTRVAHESIFSDLNNLNVVTSASDEYATAFGFTQTEVDESLAQYGLEESRAEVERWYDGFTFGGRDHIYNPWSITNYLAKRRLAPYWANTSANSLVSSLVRRADADFKSDFETLLQGGTVTRRVSEQIVFLTLGRSPSSAWSLLAASGYLRVVPAGDLSELTITNHETMLAFDDMVDEWFEGSETQYNGFVRALLSGDVRAMNAYLVEVALDTFSSFDVGTRPSGAQPERFYHGFVLGLLVELRGRYRVRSNRESGFGRYDVALVPTDPSRDPGIVLEFKVLDAYSGEKSLEDAVAAAHAQIDEKRYAQELVSAGVPRDRVRTYGIAFEGKRVLVG